MEWGCMQALIDYNGWKKWRTISAEKQKDEAKQEAAKKAAEKAKAERKSKKENLDGLEIEATA